MKKLIGLIVTTMLISAFISVVSMGNGTDPDSKTYTSEEVKLAEKIKNDGKEYRISKDGTINTPFGEITPPKDIFSTEEVGILAAYDRYFRVRTSGSDYTGVASTITFPTGIVVGTDSDGKTDVLYKYEGFNDSAEAGFHYINGQWVPFAGWWVGPSSDKSNFRWWQSSAYTSSSADLKLKINGTINGLTRVDMYINGVIVKTLDVDMGTTGSVKRLNTVVGYTQLATYDNSLWRNSYVTKNNTWYLWTTSYPLVSENETNGSFTNTWNNKYYNNTINLR